MIHLLEQYLQKYNIPHALVDGGKILLLSEDELTWPDENDLFSCILNQAQVQDLMSDPAKKTLRFKGIWGASLAATTVQKAWRRFKAYTAYN